tara:strand:- start:1266 stop:1994 length:729 start_codon:yes stop_codon:yes gene_type:complete
LELAGELPPLESVYLVRGSLLHVGLAHYYQRKKAVAANQNPDEWLTPEQAILKLAKQEGAQWVVEIDLILTALREYLQYWSQDDWVPLEVEYELRARIPHPVAGEERFLFTQRADLIVKDGAGKVWIVDHKTASRINQGSLDQYILSGQMVGYQHFGRALYGERFAGVLLNRIKIYEPLEFDRRVVPPAPVATAGFVETLKWAEYLDHTVSLDPMKAPMATRVSACYGKYGKCPAFDLCRFG